MTPRERVGATCESEAEGDGADVVLELCHAYTLGGETIDVGLALIHIGLAEDERGKFPGNTRQTVEVVGELIGEGIAELTWLHLYAGDGLRRNKVVECCLVGRQLHLFQLLALVLKGGDGLFVTRIRGEPGLTA